MMTMGDFTPTTGEVRKRYIVAELHDCYWEGDSDSYLLWPDAIPTGEEFDRWLEAHDREVAAKALEKAAQWLTVATVDPAYEGQLNDGEFGSGFYQGIRSSRRALRTCAVATHEGVNP